MRRAIVFAFLVCSGCAVRQPAIHPWQLVRQEAAHVLVPPDVATPDLAQRTFPARVAAGCGHFPSAEGAIAIVGRGKHARVTVTRNSLEKQPTGWLGEWASQLEDHACLPPGTGFSLATRVAESIPLEPAAAFALLYADEKQSGVVDIGPQTRLQVVSPLWREPGLGLMASGPYKVEGSDRSLTVTGKSTDNLLGYEIAQYGVQPRGKGAGYKIAPRYADRHIQGKTERRPQPAINFFQFPPDAAFYRIFYKSYQNDFTALVIAAHTPAALDRRTQILQARGASASCEDLNMQMCVALPKDIGLIPLISVIVNGAEVLLTRGSNVLQTIDNSGPQQPNAVLTHLVVRKPWNGRLIDVAFDHADAAILKLALTGGETISWKE